MTFQLDTTGHVVNIGEGTNAARQPILFWSDLSPFTQGYVEALFSDVGGTPAEGFGRCCLSALGCAFSDFAPETLARIIADCERASKRLASHCATGGASFWRMRQRGDFVGGLFVWPPLTVQLGDDGKVRFAETATSDSA